VPRFSWNGGPSHLTAQPPPISTRWAAAVKGKGKKTMREELDEFDWPQEWLVGSLVHQFNRADPHEERTILAGDMMLIFEIEWDHFARVDRSVARQEINKILARGLVEFLPSNKDGLVVEHVGNHVKSYFDMDGTYYVQHGHISMVWRK
jgi:hypothetical protein